MNKKYIVRLNDQERQELVAVITKLKGTSQKVKRAQILLKADVDGPNWPHYQIAEAFLCRTRTVSNVCKSLVERGFDITLLKSGKSGGGIGGHLTYFSLSLRSFQRVTVHFSMSCA